MLRILIAIILIATIVVPQRAIATPPIAMYIEHGSKSDVLVVGTTSFYTIDLYASESKTHLAQNYTFSGGIAKLELEPKYRCGYIEVYISYNSVIYLIRTVQRYCAYISILHT